MYLITVNFEQTLERGRLCKKTWSYHRTPMTIPGYIFICAKLIRNHRDKCQNGLIRGNVIYIPGLIGGNFIHIQGLSRENNFEY